MSAFGDFKAHFGVVFERFANPDKSAAVFFDVAGEVEGLGNQFVSQLGGVVVCVKVFKTQPTIKPPRAVDRDPFIENLDLDVRPIGVITMHNGIDQGFPKGWQGIRKALFSLHRAIKLKGHAQMRDDEFHGLLRDFKQGVGELPIVDDKARGFEAADVDVVPEGFASEKQHCRPCGLAV